MNSFVLFYEVPPISQRGLYLLARFRRFILKVDGFQHPQAAFYIVPFTASAFNAFISRLLMVFVFCIFARSTFALGDVVDRREDGG